MGYSKKSHIRSSTPAAEPQCSCSPATGPPSPRDNSIRPPGAAPAHKTPRGSHKSGRTLPHGTSSPHSPPPAANSCTHPSSASFRASRVRLTPALSRLRRSHPPAQCSAPPRSRAPPSLAASPSTEKSPGHPSSPGTPPPASHSSLPPNPSRAQPPGPHRQPAHTSHAPGPRRPHPAAAPHPSAAPQAPWPSFENSPPDSEYSTAPSPPAQPIPPHQTKPKLQKRLAASSWNSPSQSLYQPAPVYASKFPSRQTGTDAYWKTQSLLASFALHFR